MFDILHIKLEAGLKRRAEEASKALELRNLSAFVRMCIAEKVNAVLGKETPLPVYVASKDKH